MATKIKKTVKSAAKVVKTPVVEETPVQEVEVENVEKKTAKKASAPITSVTTQKDLFSLIAERTGTSQKEASDFYTAFVDSLKTIASNPNEDEVKFVLPEIGTFVIFVEPEHVSRNPRTGENVTVPEKKRVRFKTFPKFTKAINEAE